MILTAAVVGPTNQPLYLADLAGLPSAEALRQEQMMYCSLDVAEERTPAPGAARGELGANYLGVLYAAEQFKVVGFATATRHRLLLVVDDPTIQDAEFEALFRRLQRVLVDAICNPFYTPNTPLTSTKFDASVRAIALSLGAA